MLLFSKLWQSIRSDATGLPVESYTEEEVKVRAEEISPHVYRVYPKIPSPFYEKTMAA